MRDGNGVYIGESRCMFYLGVDRMEQHECCGGKVFNVAYSRCEVRGVLKAEPDCSRSQCPKIKEA
jgi:hypothetical protein